MRSKKEYDVMMGRWKVRVRSAAAWKTIGCLWIAGALAAMLGVCAGSAEGQSATSGSVSGKVVQDPGGQGIRKVIVELVKKEEREGGGVKEYKTATDASGVFRMEGVEAGGYEVELTRPGFYTTKNKGQEWTVTIEAGKEAAGLLYRMEATGVIAGRVVDAEGDPLANASVRAIPKGKSGMAGKRQGEGEPSDPSMADHAVSNDLGEFRIAELEPGPYVLEVEPPMWVGPAPNPADKGRQREKVLFTKTYYPGTMEEGQASTVMVVSGGTATANVTLLTNRAYRVSGTVNGTGGGQMEQIVLVSPSGTAAQTNIEEGGRFEFQNVQPGMYEARIVLLTGAGEGRPTMKVEMVKSAIVVEGDVSGLELVPEAGGKVKGKFRAEDDGAIDWTQFTVRLEAVPEAVAGSSGPEALGMSEGVELGSDGTFEFEDVPGGTYQLAVSVKSEIYRDDYVKSVMESGREVADTGFAVTGGAGLEVVVSAKGGKIAGTVVDGEGKPVSNAEVVAVPASGQRMRPDAYQTDKTNGQGQYALRGMSPGQYILVALEGAHEDARSGAFTTKYGTAGEPVELSEGEKKTVTVKVAEAKE